MASKREIFNMWIKGNKDISEIAQALNTDEQTVRNALQELEDKLGAWYRKNSTLQEMRENHIAEVKMKLDLVQSELWKKYSELNTIETDEGLTIAHVQAQISTLYRILDCIDQERDLFGLKGTLLSESEVKERIAELKKKLKKLKGGDEQVIMQNAT